MKCCVCVCAEVKLMLKNNGNVVCVGGDGIDGVAANTDTDCVFVCVCVYMSV